MKTQLFSFIVISFGLFLYSCDVYDNDVVPNNKVTTMQATYSDYDMIDASSAFTVYVTFSDVEESIEIEANENLHKYIEVKKENDVLKIGLERNVSIHGSATLNAYITTRNVSGYAASGASRFIVENTIEAEDINIYLSGASRFTGQVAASNLYTDISGASVMDVDGFSNIFEAEASGASVIRDYGFETNSLIADLSGASSMYVSVEDEIKVEASGASSLHFKGSAVITHQDISGASSVKAMN